MMSLLGDQPAYDRFDCRWLADLVMGKSTQKLSKRACQCVSADE